MANTNTFTFENVCIGDEQNVKMIILTKKCQIHHEYTITNKKCRTIGFITNFEKYTFGEETKYLLTYVEDQYYDQKNEKNSQIELGCIYTYIINSSHWTGSYLILPEKLMDCSTNSARNTKITIAGCIPSMSFVSQCMNFLFLSVVVEGSKYN